MKKIRSLLKNKGLLSAERLKISVSGAVLALLCGCVSGSVPLYETVWRPVEKAPEGVHLIFTADQRRVVGCCGSNRFFGPVKFESKGKISIGMLGATRMASPHYRYEQKFLDDLKAAHFWEIDKRGALVLRDVDGRVCLRLKPDTQNKASGR